MVGIKLDDKFNLLAIFLLIVGFINVFLDYYFWKDYNEIFWFCNFACFVCGYAILRKNIHLVTATFVTAVPMQFLWIVDFLLNYFLDFSFGRTVWLAESPGIVFFFSTLTHSILIPITLYYIYKNGFGKKAMYYVAILYGVIMLSGSYYFTGFQENINCVFYPCDLIYELEYYEVDMSTYYKTPFYLVQEIFSNVGMVALFYLACFEFLRKRKWKMVE